MAALIDVLISDTFDQLRQKINAIGARLNNLTVANNVFTLSAPNDGDMLVYNAGDQTFHNTTTAAFAAQILSTSAGIGASPGKQFFISTSRSVF